MKINAKIRETVKALKLGAKATKNILEGLRDDEMIFQRAAPRELTARIEEYRLEKTVLLSAGRHSWTFDHTTGELLDAQ